MVAKLYPGTGHSYTKRILVNVEVKRNDVGLRASVRQTLRYTQLAYDQGKHTDIRSYLVIGKEYLTIGIVNGAPSVIHQDPRPVFDVGGPQSPLSLARVLSEIGIKYWNYV